MLTNISSDWPCWSADAKWGRCWLTRACHINGAEICKEVNIKWLWRPFIRRELATSLTKNFKTTHHIVWNFWHIILLQETGPSNCWADDKFPQIRHQNKFTWQHSSNIWTVSSNHKINGLADHKTAYISPSIYLIGMASLANGHTFAKYRFWQLTALINISGPIWLIVLFNGMCRGILLSWSFLIVDNVSAQRIFLEASGWTNCCLSGKCKHGWLVLTISTTNIYFHNINEYHIWMVTANGEQMAEVLSYRKRFYSTKSFEKTYSHAW